MAGRGWTGAIPGGEADTMAAIAGSIAAPYYGCVPEDLAREVRERLPGDILDALERFEGKGRRPLENVE